MIKYAMWLLFVTLTYGSSAESTFKNRCASCHGQTGLGIAGYSPRLAGQHWQYLLQQMKDIRSGDRDNGQSSVMKPMFKTLSDEEMHSLSKYIGGLK